MELCGPALADALEPLRPTEVVHAFEERISYAGGGVDRQSGLGSGIAKGYRLNRDGGLLDVLVGQHFGRRYKASHLRIPLLVRIRLVAAQQDLVGGYAETSANAKQRLKVGLPAAGGVIRIGPLRYAADPSHLGN